MLSGEGSRAVCPGRKRRDGEAVSGGIVNVDALAEAPGTCTATANGSGAGGEAYACLVKMPGSVVTAVSTKGSIAIGYDT
jgi:hypothetical protein